MTRFARFHPLPCVAALRGGTAGHATTYIAAMALVGSLSYGLLVGKVERIDA